MTAERARTLLREAEAMNPGLWADHCRVAADTARAIAARCPGLHVDKAYCYGLLHDIGRREGWRHISHTLDGYRYLSGLGYDEAAAICLTHSFPVKDTGTYHGEIDCSEDDLRFLQDFLDRRDYTDYDLLVQFCDAIAMPHGAVLMEKRLVDVVMRYGMPTWTGRKWKAYFDLKRHFDALAGCNIYDLLPDVAVNTFR